MKKPYTRPLTAQEMLNLRDEDIDTSDIPELEEEWFVNAEVTLKKRKKSVTLRVDEAILDYFRRQGKGYQTRMNAVLTAYVTAHNPQFTS